MKLYLPNSASLQNIEGFISRFDPSDPSRLDFSMHPKYAAVHPFVLALAASVGNHVTRAGGIHFGEVQKVASLPYLIRMGLFDHIRLDYGSGIAAHEEAGRFIPITRIANARELTDFIVNFIPLLHADPQQVEPIRYVISELVRNVLEHANSPDGAYICAQYFHETHKLSLGVADAGIGIHATISRYHSAPTPWDAIVLAMRPGISGTTSRIGGTDYNAGAGLFFTKSIACASRNYFVIYSGDAMFKLRKTPKGQTIYLYPDASRDHHTKRTTMPPWTGTVVGVDISIDPRRPFVKLMNLIRDAYGLDIRDKSKQHYKKPRFTQ